jgi:pimeloyl-ACP methyl ester carboxylesterase
VSQITTNGRQTLDTSFGSIRYWEAGADTGRPPLVFLQGLLSGADVWAEVVGHLGTSRRCVCVDWPFGAHAEPLDSNADLSPPGIARLAIEVMDGLGLGRAVLVGNDSGGVIAQLVLATNPDRVAAAVLVSCDAFECFPPGVWRYLFTLAGLPGVVSILTVLMGVPVIARSRLGFGAVIARNPARFAHWSIPSRTDGRIRRDLAKLMHGSSNSQTLDAAKHFAQFPGPVLVVWAKQDRLFEQSLGRRLAAAFPHGSFEQVEGSRTFVPCDQPQRLAALIEEFLDLKETF